MKLLSKKCVGIVEECPQCGAVFAYDIADIYENKYIYCPQCRLKILSHMDLSYDGVIKEKKE